MRFDLTDLKLFLHVVEAGSITAGAERMHLAVAAASTRIRNMEIELGTALLNRDRQGVQPTPAGRTLVHHARLLLQQAERMRGELSEYADGLKGHIRLMSNTNALTEFLPEPLSQFLASHPQVNIDLEERLSDEIVAAVADGQADIGIVAAPRTSPAWKSSRSASIASCSSRRRGHPLAAAGRIAFAEALDCDFVGLDRTSSLQRFLSEKAERTGRRLKLRVQLRSFDAVCRLVECNVGVGVVPETTAVRSMKTMSLRRIDLTDDWALRNLTICVRRLADLPIHAQELVRSLAATRRNTTGTQRMLRRICAALIAASAFGMASADTVVRAQRARLHADAQAGMQSVPGIVIEDGRVKRLLHGEAMRRSRTQAPPSSTAAASTCSPGSPTHTATCSVSAS